jgi:hypothetical protein
MVSPPNLGVDGDVVLDGGNTSRKKMDAGVDADAVANPDSGSVGAAVGYGTFGVHESHREPAFSSE